MGQTQESLTVSGTLTFEKQHAPGTNLPASRQKRLLSFSVIYCRKHKRPYEEVLDRHYMVSTDPKGHQTCFYYTAALYSSTGSRSNRGRWLLRKNASVLVYQTLPSDYKSIMLRLQHNNSRSALCWESSAAYPAALGTAQ